MLDYVKKRAHINTMRSAAQRMGDFDERDRSYTEEEARLISAHCGDCKTPSCATGFGNQTGGMFLQMPAFAGLPIITQSSHTECPLGNNIPAWENAVSIGDFDEANRLMRETNPWPETGQLCPDNLCESNCLLAHAGHKTGHIRGIERFIADWSWKTGKVEPLKILGDLNKNVVIVGTGPAGYAVGERLRMAGANVTFYDMNDVPGGLATRGLPGFKIANHRITRYFTRLAEAGVRFHMKMAVGRDIGFHEMIRKHKADAVFLGLGTYDYKGLPNLKGGAAGAAIQGILLLQAQNKRDDGQLVPEFIDGSYNMRDKHVVIVGAGDTAFDALGTAIRHGAKKITMLVRGDDMRAIQKEIKANMEEAAALAAQRGVDLSAILEIRKRSQVEEVHGTSLAVEAVTVKGPNGLETIPAQKLILAIGSDGADLKKDLGLSSVQTRQGNLLRVHQLLDTKPVLDGGRGGRGGGLVGLYQMSSRAVPVFSGGDIALDRSNPHDKALIVTALRDGRNTVPDMIYALENPGQIATEYDHLSLNR